MKAEKKRKHERRRGLALLMRDNLKFQGILTEGPFKKYIQGEETF